MPGRESIPIRLRLIEPIRIEPPVLDFSGLAGLYGWRHLQATTERELDACMNALGTTLKRNTLLELKLDPALKPVTASRHF